MDFQEMVNYRNTHNPFAQKVGIWVEEIGPGWARAVKTVTAEDLNPLTRAHGGVYFSLADTACGSAAGSRGSKLVTLSANYNFLRGAKVGDKLIAEAHEVKTGRTICVFSVRVTDQTGSLLGDGTFTFFQVEPASQA